MAQGISTEWEDIHVKLGNYLPRNKSPTLKELDEANLKAAEEFDPLEKKDLDELDELEDEFDDEFMQEYKKKRMTELKKMASKPCFGSVLEITRTEFIHQVNDAPKDVKVLIHLYHPSIEESNLVNQILEEIAKKYRNVKIVKIVGDKCIETLPIEKCPGFVVYENGQLITQLIPAVGELGGQNMNFKCKMIYKYYIQLWNGFLEC